MSFFEEVLERHTFHHFLGKGPLEIEKEFGSTVVFVVDVLLHGVQGLNLSAFLPNLEVPQPRINKIWQITHKLRIVVVKEFLVQTVEDGPYLCDEHVVD